MRVPNRKSQIANRKFRFGFTLVEMLVVIAIIGILVALLVPAVLAAITTSKNAAITMEMSQLASALEAYKQKYTEYPPDFTSTAAVIAHLSRAFPRNTENLVNSAGPGYWYAGNAATASRHPSNLDPSEALVLWLSEVRTNPRKPLTGTGDPVSFYDFDETRLIDTDGDGWMEYVSKQAPETPYVYFDGRNLGGNYLYTTAVYPLSTPQSNSASAFGVSRPYRTNTFLDCEDNGRTLPNTLPSPLPVCGDVYWNTVSGDLNTTWVEPGKFQIITAGLDGQFGPDLWTVATPFFKQFPDPNYPFSDEDEDNLASFSDGKTILNSVP